jgi:hypothetical protein
MPGLASILTLSGAMTNGFVRPDATLIDATVVMPPARFAVVYTLS